MLTYKLTVFLIRSKEESRLEEDHRAGGLQGQGHHHKGGHDEHHHEATILQREILHHVEVLQAGGITRLIIEIMYHLIIAERVLQRDHHRGVHHVVPEALHPETRPQSISVVLPNEEILRLSHVIDLETVHTSHLKGGILLVEGSLRIEMGLLIERNHQIVIGGRLRQGSLRLILRDLLIVHRHVKVDPHPVNLRKGEVVHHQHVTLIVPINPRKNGLIKHGSY